MPFFPRVLALPDLPLSPGRYYALAAALAAACAASLFPADFFSGSNGFWFAPGTDPTQHITGLWAFTHDRWRFPLLHTTLLNAPEGVSVAFTDSIPLAALLFKPLYPLLPAGSHYFGVWLLLCYVLQGVAGAGAVAVAGRHTLSAALTGSLFAVMMPALAIRLPHGALLAQWLLIVMLGLYHARHADRIGPAALLGRGSALVLLAGAIHPYLLAMVYVLYAAAVLADAWRRREIRMLAGWLLPLPPLALLLYVLGYLSVSSGLPPPEDGFVASSMNLLSPLFGTPLAGARFLPASPGLVLDATGMQIDGHNYLGIGLWLMLMFIVCTQPRRTLAFVRTHWIMAALLAGLFAYSLSSVVHLGGRVLFTYPLPAWIEPLTRIFRGSGRFFWPVGYALLLCALGFFLSRRQPGYRFALLALLLLQYADMRPHRAYLAEAASRAPVFAHDRTAWDTRVSQASAVFLLPGYGCGASIGDASFLQYFTTLHGVPFNTGFVARVVSHCAAMESVMRRPRKPGELFVFTPGRYSPAAINAAMGGQAAGWCRDEDIGTVCAVPRAVTVPPAR